MSAPSTPAADVPRAAQDRKLYTELGAECHDGVSLSFRDQAVAEYAARRVWFEDLTARMRYPFGRRAES